MISIFDNVLTEQEHYNINQLVKNITWTQGWGSSTRRPEVSHWNFSFSSPEQMLPSMDSGDYAKMFETYPELEPLWKATDKLLRTNHGKFDVLRFYSNCNPYGQNGYIHEDDGDYTVIYYPALKWDAEWEGGTCLYSETKGEYDAIRYVSYKPNRLLVFPANIPHRAMPVDKLCLENRIVVVMKLQRDVNHPSYMENYYAQ